MQYTYPSSFVIRLVVKIGPTARDARRITAEELKYMRTITGHTRTDYKT